MLALPWFKLLLSCVGNLRNKSISAEQTLLEPLILRAITGIRILVGAYSKVYETVLGSGD